MKELAGNMRERKRWHVKRTGGFSIERNEEAKMAWRQYPSDNTSTGKGRDGGGHVLEYSDGKGTASAECPDGNISRIYSVASGD